MPRIMLLGPPGSGKGTQAAKIKKTYGIPAISTGDALREQLGAGTELGKRAKSYIDAGELVPDGLIIELVKGLLSGDNTKNGFLLDGFPRTIAQAEALDAFLEEKVKQLDMVFFLKVPKEMLIKRIVTRMVCPACGMSYHVDEVNPFVHELCGNCGAELIHRVDDEPDTAEKRIEVYNKQTKPLIEYYKKQGILIELDGTRDVETLQEQIDKALKAV